MNTTENRFDVQVQLALLTPQFSIDIEPHPFAISDFTPDEPLVYEIIKNGIPINFTKSHKKVN